MVGFWIGLVAGVVVLTVVVLRWHRRRQPIGRMSLVQAKRRFHTQRERLEAKFVQLAAARSPQWTECNFADDVAYVRDRTTGELSAFVAVTLGAEHRDLPFPSGQSPESFQAGTAVFRFDRDHWETEGRAILNLTPAEAVERCREKLEIVGEELAHRI